MAETKLLDDARYKAKLRRQAAIHEAGHVVIARYFGCAATAFINTNEDDKTEERLGRTVCWARGSLWEGEAHFQEAEWSEQQHKICLAGGIAEWRGLEDSAEDAWSNLYLGDVYSIYNEFVSSGDKFNMYLPLGDVDEDDEKFEPIANEIIETCELVEKLWSEVWKTSTKLISDYKELKKLNLIAGTTP